MQKKRIHNRSVILWLLLVVMLMTTASPLLAADAEYIWAENDFPGSTLYISTYQNGAWGEKEPIFSDENLNILPALGSDSKGNYLAVWVTLMPGGRSILKYSWQEGNGWTEPDILWNGFKENLAPVVLFDAADTPWVFWSANDGGDDDIYMSFYTGNSWSTPRQVNKDNDVPDILPLTTLDENGDVVVVWRQMQSDAAYKEMSKVLTDVSQTSPLVKNKKFIKSRTASDVTPESIPNPPFEGNSRSTIHYPGDFFTQFTTIKKRTDR